MSRLIALVVTISAVIALVGCTAAPTTTPAAPMAAPADAPAVTVGTITISEPWVRPANPMAPAASDGYGNAPATSGHSHGSSDSHSSMGPMVNTAGYMLLRNTGSEPDFLIAASADFAEVVELHTMVMQDSVMKMDKVERIEIPAGGEVALQPGGLHVMFLGVNQELKAGGTTSFTLTFEKGGSVTLEAPVRMP